MVDDPENCTKQTLEFLGLPWHNDVLKHHLLHEGESIGETQNARAIDKSSLEKWRKGLDDEDLKTVSKICQPLAEQLSYEL